MSATIWHIYVGCGEPSDGKMAAGSEQFVKASDYAALEARCKQQQNDFDALYSRNVFIEASLASNKQRIAELEAALRRADDIEHSISAEDWYKQRDALLGSAKETQDE